MAHHPPSPPETKHLPLRRRKYHNIRRIPLDHAHRKTAEFVVHPDIFAGMQAKIILPEAAGE
jgi:hypothetical protein